MFGNNSLPLPSPLAQEHRPLRLTSEPSRPQPIGRCHYLASQGTTHQQNCSCQTYQHNRAAPGNLCDCGHSACYHAQSIDNNFPTIEITIKHLTEKLKRLEETTIREREIRDSILLRERQAWEREIRVLREALAPFYKSEQDMRRKLMELEDRVEGTYDEQVRLKEVVVAIDDAGMVLEKRLDQWEQNPRKRRKINHESERNGVSSSRSSTGSSHAESRAVSQVRSPAHTHVNGVRPVGPSSPRSSGVLNLVSMPRVQRSVPPPPYTSARRRPLSPPLDTVQEVRSSGFLALNLVGRVGKTEIPIDEPKVEGSPEAQDNEDSHDSPTGVQTPPPGIVPPGPLSLPALLSSNAFVHAHDRRHGSSLLKRKNQMGLMALDVLANVSVASPPVQ